jgi:micrococcal nuclease
MLRMPTQMYVYRAQCLRVIDGDTLDMTISLGLHDYRDERIRLLRVNAPEVHGATKAAGDAATTFVHEWLDSASGEWPLIIQTSKSDDFGRFLGTVWRVLDGACLNEALVSSGHAVPFMVDKP